MSMKSNMQNIFVFSLMVIFATILTLNTNRAINVTYALNSINEAVFLDSIDYYKSYGKDEYALAIYPTKLETNIIQILKKNKLNSTKLKLTFNYYNVNARLDCIAYNLICNGVRLHIQTDIQYFYTSRTYIYEIVPN